jgi:hypothetical protein
VLQCGRDDEGPQGWGPLIWKQGVRGSIPLRSTRNSLPHRDFPVAISPYVEDGVGQRSKTDPVRQQWEAVFRQAHELSPGLVHQSPTLAIG